jgi:hypothetical protein
MRARSRPRERPASRVLDRERGHRNAAAHERVGDDVTHDLVGHEAVLAALVDADVQHEAARRRLVEVEVHALVEHALDLFDGVAGGAYGWLPWSRRGRDRWPGEAREYTRAPAAERAGARRMEQIRIVDPGGIETADGKPGLDPPPRPRTLEGARLATLDNGKPNAGYVLSRLATALAGHAGAVPGPARGKALASKPCPEELLAELEDADAALVGVGD